MHKPLCVPHVSGAPGTQASSRRARQSVGIATHVLGRGRRAGRGVGTTRPSPSRSPGRPPPVHRVERMGCSDALRNQAVGRGPGPSPSPVAKAHSFQRGGGRAAPLLRRAPLPSWQAGWPGGAQLLLRAARALRTNTQGTQGRSGRFFLLTAGRWEQHWRWSRGGSVSGHCPALDGAHGALAGAHRRSGDACPASGNRARGRKGVTPC